MKKLILLILSSFYLAVLSLNCVYAELGQRGKRYKYGGAYIGSDPSMSYDSRKIVFGSTRYGLGDICSINSDGTKWIRLTTTPEYDGEPEFSPDGNKIVFVSERDGCGEIYIMNSDGSNQNRLTANKYYDANPSFSPDGSKIVYARNIKHHETGILFSHIFIMKSDGTNNKKITHGNAWYSGPKFSQDGNKIIFRKDWQGGEGSIGIGMMDSDGLNEIIIKKCHCFYPSLSPNGKKVLFIADTNDDAEYGLYLMFLESDTLKRLPLNKSIDMINPVYVKNGTKILFLNRLNEKGGQIATINEDGTDLNIISKTY